MCPIVVVYKIQTKQTSGRLENPVHWGKKFKLFSNLAQANETENMQCIRIRPGSHVETRPSTSSIILSIFFKNVYHYYKKEVRGDI